MFGLIIVLALMALLFRIGFYVTGALLAAVIWLCIKLPLAMIVACMGLMFCMTIILIPLGSKLFGLAGSLLFG